MDKKYVKVIDLGKMEYGQALDIQRNARDRRIAGECGDILFLVEHTPVLTMGRRGQDDNVVVSEEFLKENGIDIHWVERGGDVTYHGPGQLVVYPIFDLTAYGKDIRTFVGNLQDSIIEVLNNEYSIDAHAEDGKHTGVYVGTNKIAAIGLAIRKWVSMHGFAFNVNTDLSHFRWIVPCGLGDRGVTSVRELTGREADFNYVKGKIVETLAEKIGFEYEYSEIESVNI
ncbi:MAG: lipoyl(octanoyl) transferase LipB [Clostridia bacterium]|nr:lipoyl(octanoyl) transferase LipB [Clostridia bacterium]MBN2883440.1 lipoyl(octanoyl) transferase LipB [Clostridia bacterium]